MHFQRSWRNGYACFTPDTDHTFRNYGFCRSNLRRTLCGWNRSPVFFVGDRRLQRDCRTHMLNVNSFGFGVETNTLGASYPNDLSDIMIHPSFALLPGGFSEDFQASFVSGPWIGIAGQSLNFLDSFITQVNQPVTMVLNQVTTAESGNDPREAGIPQRRSPLPPTTIPLWCSWRFQRLITRRKLQRTFDTRGRYSRSRAAHLSNGRSQHTDAALPHNRCETAGWLQSELVSRRTNGLRGIRRLKLPLR